MHSRLVFHLPERKEFGAVNKDLCTEKLLDFGDAMFIESHGVPEIRIHSAAVSDDEVHKVVAHLRNQGKPDYIENVFADVQSLGDGRVVGESGLPEDAEEGEGDYDELYDKAVAIVTESRRASISGVQRRLKIGYNRAARLIERMEADGIVSPPEHNGNREVLAPPPPEL